MDSKQVKNSVWIGWNNPKITQRSQILSNTHALFPIFEEGSLLVWMRKSIVSSFICFYVSTAYQHWQIPIPSNPREHNRFPDPGTHHLHKVKPFFPSIFSQINIHVSWSGVTFIAPPRASTLSLASPRQVVSFNVSAMPDPDAQARQTLKKIALTAILNYDQLEVGRN